MKRMTILIDMDDTIEQLLKAWIAKVNRIYNTTTKYEDIKVWDVSAAFDGLSKEQVYSVIMDDDFWETVEPIPNASDVIKSFIDKGHTVYIVTATPYQSIKAKMDKVLFRYFPYLSWENVIITSNKQLLKADILIDDGVHNLAGGEYMKILMTAPNNLQYDAEKNGMIRVKDWNEIDRIVSALEKEG